MTATRLRVDTASGLLPGARQVASPNCDDRPDPADISLIVVHGISLPPAVFGGGEIEAFFSNCLDCDAHPFFNEIRALTVSAHLLIRRDGELVQFVPFHRRAWHAGESRFDGRESCNDYSIGIELEGTDNIAYEPRQYTQLAAVVAALCAAYPRLDPGRIAGHSDVAPGRKTDPGPAFEWPRLHACLAEHG